jgi:hypothetical protein
MVFLINKAHNGLNFDIFTDIKLKNKKSFISVDDSKTITDKEKITILLSFIPIIGFYNYPKYNTNSTIKLSTSLNLLISLIFLSLYIYSKYVLLKLFLLIYIIFVVFN